MCFQPCTTLVDAQALLESAFLTFVPLFLLTGDVHGKGVVTSTFDYGTTTFALVVLQVSLKVRVVPDTPRLV